jgi:hypothetical protein
MSNRGLLLTMTEPPAAMEEEFNAWYDEEHLAERLAIPGFLSAQRWVADLPPGQGKYLATYEVTSLAVLRSPQYLARFENQSPWSRRCLGKAVVFKRWACEQVHPGQAGPHPRARAVGLAFHHKDLAFAGVLQVRRFVADELPLALYELAQNPPKAAALLAYRLYRT